VALFTWFLFGPTLLHKSYPLTAQTRIPRCWPLTCPLEAGLACTIRISLTGNGLTVVITSSPRPQFSWTRTSSSSKNQTFPHRQNLSIGLLERRGVCRSNIGPPAIESTDESARHCALPPKAPIAIAPLKIQKMGDILEPGIWEEKEGLRRGPIYNTRIWLTDLLRPAILTRGRGGKQQSRRTAYLDGLRGFAAFLVYWHHHQLWPRQNYLIMGADYIFENSWGSWFSCSSSLCLFGRSSCKLPGLFFSVHQRRWHRRNFCTSNTDGDLV
jgi:hypothetical protein